MFLSRLRVLFPLLFLFLLSKNYILCLWRLFWSLTKNSSKRQKHTKLSSDRHILLFGTFTIRLSFISFFSIIQSTSTKGRSRLRVRLVSRCCDRRKTSPRSRGKRGGKIILFLRAKKRKLLPSSSSVVVVWSLLFYNYLWIIFARAPWASSLVLLLPSRGSNRRVVVVGRSRPLLLILSLSFTHTRSLSSLLKNRHLLEASIDHFSKQKTHNFFE